MALLKNGTMISASNTGTAGYSFPSAGSFTHQKQPNMPSDQKAKLLAMHRDGKANAGIYVAVVLVVYFILVIILLCRYGKRRRAPEPSTGLDSATEQGRLQLINFHIGKMTSCGGGGDGCFGNLSNLCFGRCQRVETSSNKPVVLTAQNGADGDKSMGKSVSVENDTQILQGKDDIIGGKGKETGICTDMKKGLNERTEEDTRDHDDHHNEDSEESLEDD